VKIQTATARLWTATQPTVSVRQKYTRRRRCENTCIVIARRPVCRFVNAGRNGVFQRSDRRSNPVFSAPLGLLRCARKDAWAVLTPSRGEPREKRTTVIAERPVCRFVNAGRNGVFQRSDQPSNPVLSAPLGLLRCARKDAWVASSRSRSTLSRKTKQIDQKMISTSQVLL